MADKKIGIYWFTNDLRIVDNPLLARAAVDVDMLICLYCDAPIGSFLKHFSQQTAYGQAKKHFHSQCLASLDQSLQSLGQRLVLVNQAPIDALSQIIEQHKVTHLFCDQFVGYDENHVVEQLKSRFPDLTVEQQSLRSLFSLSELPFSIEQLPPSFSRFRKQVESLPIGKPSSAVHALPSMVKHSISSQALPRLTVSTEDLFIGGESFAHSHCQCYFATSFPRSYKQTRNQLDEFESSTKFSPWLALGCLSAKQIIASLQDYERLHGSNDSTYWIYIELLWREYFQWYSLKFGRKLFAFSGIAEKRPLTSFYSQRFKQWCQGRTAYPIVNACMKQLNQTGYMSNRGRQLAASCLIYELGLDWRYGAAYFETQLIDFDVGSNWGNWQYIAGIGASKTERHFNLAKQTEFYDPNKAFIHRWGGEAQLGQNDYVNIDDWPLMPDESN